MGEGSIQTKISRFLLRYRTTPHSTTGVPPSELLMKRKLHTQLDRIFPSVADRVQSKQSKQKAVHDYHANERTLEEGQAVHAKDFRYKKTWLPGTLVEKTGLVSARIQLDDGTVTRRHHDHVRVRESAAAAASITSEIPEATPIAISEPVASSANSRQSAKSPVAPPRGSPMHFSPKQSRPVRRRVQPAYLDVILTFCIRVTVWRDTKFSHVGHMMCNRIFVVY
ncbi:uncharacterized protein [Acropora muricata]|uniref:uncharacterized protein n=1 Tax=Acropora muricata TaxID=159855 RepID=UPI0034E56717